VIGSAVVATIETTLSDHSVIVANNHVFSLIPKPLLIPSGFLVSAIGSAPVALTTIMHRERSARSADNQRK
jgi:hypothetical protein